MRVYGDEVRVWRKGVINVGTRGSDSVRRVC